jgi:hypothetical protein
LGAGEDVTLGEEVTLAEEEVTLAEEEDTLEDVTLETEGTVINLGLEIVDVALGAGFKKLKI